MRRTHVSEHKIYSSEVKMATPVFNPATGYYESPRADGGVNKYTSLGSEPSAEFKRLTKLYEEQKGRTLYATPQPQAKAGQPAFGQKVLTEYQLHPELYPRPQVSAFYKSPEKLEQEFKIDVATKKGLQPEFIKTMVGEIEPRYRELDIEASRAIQEANKNLAPGVQPSPLVYKGHVDTPMEQRLQAGSFVNTTYVPDVEKVEGFHQAPAGYIGSKYIDPTGVERKYNLAEVAKQGYLIPKQGLEKFDFGIGSRYAPLGYFPKEGYWKPVGNVIMKEGRHEAGVLDYTSPAEGRLRAGKEGTLYQSETGQWLLVDVYGQTVSGGSVGSPLVAGTDYELTNKKLKQQSSPGTLISKGFTWATFPTESSLVKQKAADEKIRFQAAEQRMYKTKYPEATFPEGKEFGVFPEPRSRFPETSAAKTPAATSGSEPGTGLPKSAAAGVLNLAWMGERASVAPQTGKPTTVIVDRFPKVIIPSLGKPPTSEGIEKIPGGRAGVGASQVPYREAAGVGAYPFKRSYEVGGIMGETAYAAGGEAERRTGLYQRSRPAEFPTYQNLTPMTGSGLFMPTGVATPTIPAATRGGMKGYTPPERMGEANLAPAWEGVLSGYGALQEGEAQRIARLESAKAAQRAARESLGETRASPAGLPLESTVLEHQCLYSVHHIRAIPHHKPKTKSNIQKKGVIPKKPLVAHKTKGTGIVRHPHGDVGKMERGYWNYEPTATYILGLSNDQKPKKAKKPKSQG
jgi:hypothetical protein